MHISVEIPRINILGVHIHNITRAETLFYIEQMVASGDLHLITTPNVDYVVQAQKDPQLCGILNASDLAIPDGMGVVYASHLLGTPLKGNVGGRLIVPEICMMASQNGLRVYLLGAKAGIAQMAATRLRQKYPGLIISGVQHGYFASEEEKCIVKEIRNSRSDILILALGTPNQERWMARYKGELNVPVIIGTGSTLDRISGHFSIPPKWMTDIGMEWLYRMFQEPRRLGKRYLFDDPILFWWIIQQRFGLRGFTTE